MEGSADEDEELNPTQTTQGQGGREINYNYDEFDLDEEPEIVPNDDY